MKNSATTWAAWTTAFAWGTNFAHANDPGLHSGWTHKRRLRGVQTTTESSGRVVPDQNDEVVARELQGSCVLEGNLYGPGLGTFRTVEFLYQGVFRQGTSQAQITQNILPPFERELAQGILPEFFACPSDQPTGPITGISPLDDDSLVVGVDCLSDIVGECYTFSGRMFASSTLPNEEQTQEAVLPAIQRYIQGRPEWTDIDNRLLDIVYVISEEGEIVEPDPLPGTPTPSPTPGDTTPTNAPTSANATTDPGIDSLPPTDSPADTPQSDDDESFFEKFDWWVWVLILAGGVIFICCCGVIGNNAIERERREKARGIKKPAPTESALENPIKAIGSVVEGTAKVAVGVTNSTVAAVTSSITGGSSKPSPYGDSASDSLYKPPGNNDYEPPDDLGTFDMSTNTPTPNYSIDSDHVPMTNTSAILKPVGEDEVYESASEFAEGEDSYATEEQDSYATEEQEEEYEDGEEYDDGEEYEDEYDQEGDEYEEEGETDYDDEAEGIDYEYGQEEYADGDEYEDGEGDEYEDEDGMEYEDPEYDEEGDTEYDDDPENVDYEYEQDDYPDGEGDYEDEEEGSYESGEYEDEQEGEYEDSYDDGEGEYEDDDEFAEETLEPEEESSYDEETLEEAEEGHHQAWGQGNQSTGGGSY